MRLFGPITDVNHGDEFKSRKALATAMVHPPLIAGISGSHNEGADSIVLAGGYEDDEDFGDVIIYTGAGGQKNGKQVANQELKGVNLALAKNKIENLPVRVTRGHKHKHELSPSSGYKYFGLYNVDSYWSETGKAGFTVWRFRLIAQTNHPIKALASEQLAEYGKTKRKKTLTDKIIRGYQRAKNLKSWHDYQCQICGLAIKTTAGLYAEAAHIQPLGAPHNGPDVEENLLCLCPNHHVMFDNGAFSIADDLSLIGIPGKLRLANKHKIDLKFIQYHREHFKNN